MAPTKETKETITSKVVDFSKVKDGGGNFNKRRVRSGDYLAKVVKVQDAQSKAGDFQYLYTIQLVKHATNKYPFYCQLTEKTLWKLRNLFIAGGVNVPKKRVKLDPSKVVGKLIGVTMDDVEYEGKLQSEVVAVFPASELSDSDGGENDDTDDDGVEDDDATEDDDSMDDLEDSDDDDTEDDAEEEEEADEEDEFASMDRTALKAYLKAQDASFQAKKSQSDDDLRELARAAGGDDEDEEDEPEPEPAPKPKKKKAKAKPKADDEEFEELDLDEL